MAYRSSSSTIFSGTTALTATAPAGVALNDRLAAQCTQDNAAAVFTAATGWGLLSGPVSNTAIDGQTSSLFEKKDASGSDAYNFVSSVTAAAIVQVVAWSGRNNTANAIVQSTLDDNANATPIAVGLTGVTALSGDDVGWFAQLDQNLQTDTWGFSALTNYTERQDASPGDWISQAAYTRDAVSAGATGTLTATATRATGTDVAAFSGFVVAVPAGAPSIDTQPTAQTAADGATATFTISAPTATSFQWERQPALGGSWANVSGGSGGTTNSYTTPTLSRASDAGAQYRCIATNASGSTTSNAAGLSVTAIPAAYADVGMVIGRSAVGSSKIGSSAAVGGGLSGSVSESQAATDSQAATFQVSGGRAETASATDAQTGSRSSPVSLAEAAATTDAQTGSRTSPVATSETAAATDAQAAVWQAGGAITETAAATDAQSASRASTVSVAETAAATDSQAGSRASPTSIAETSAATDAQTGSRASPVSVAETSAAVDDQDATVTSGVVSVAETSAATDAVSASLASPVSVAETSAATDSQTGLRASPTAVAETSAAVDSQDATSNGSLSGAITETSAATDVQVSTFVAVGAIAESAAASDAVASALSILRAIAETSAAADSTSAARAALGALGESLVALEILGVSAVFGGSVGESVAATDASALTAILVGALAESVAVADACNALSGSASISESVAATDAVDWLLEEVLTRVFRVIAENRGLLIAPELRAAMIAAEDRIRFMESQAREVDI